MAHSKRCRNFSSNREGNVTCNVAGYPLFIMRFFVQHSQRKDGLTSIRSVHTTTMVRPRLLAHAWAASQHRPHPSSEELYYPRFARGIVL
jgi:hypothetical protein